mmetsp:Transcript_38574/g.73881  ORF Transcript_38574/g.73881 Transcript_38574/m.73881 type:complete len:215 (-) Transcript_38574:222-866(-)
MACGCSGKLARSLLVLTRSNTTLLETKLMVDFQASRRTRKWMDSSPRVYSWLNQAQRLRALSIGAVLPSKLKRNLEQPSALVKSAWLTAVSGQGAMAAKDAFREGPADESAEPGGESGSMMSTSDRSCKIHRGTASLCAHCTAWLLSVAINWSLRSGVTTVKRNPSSPPSPRRSLRTGVIDENRLVRQCAGPCSSTLQLRTSTTPFRHSACESV